MVFSYETASFLNDKMSLLFIYKGRRKSYYMSKMRLIKCLISQHEDFIKFKSFIWKMKKSQIILDEHVLPFWVSLYSRCPIFREDDHTALIRCPWCYCCLVSLPFSFLMFSTLIQCVRHAFPHSLQGLSEFILLEASVQLMACTQVPIC